MGVFTLGGRTDGLQRASAKSAKGKWLYGLNTVKSVMASRLEEVTADLDIDEEDIDRIRRAAFRRKLLTRAFSLLTPLLSFIGGFVAAGGLVRSGEPPTSSYPYVAATLPIFNNKPFLGKAKVTILGTISLSTIAFVVGFVLGGDTFKPDPVLPMYGVSYSGRTP